MVNSKYIFLSFIENENWIKYQYAIQIFYSWSDECVKYKLGRLGDDFDKI